MPLPNVDCRLPIDLDKLESAIGNWQLAMRGGNYVGR